MPRPVGRGSTYVAGLDGVRALAVVVVLAYHLDLPWASGGLLGVGVFFTLSGYLITSILLETWQRTGGLDLRQFWVRRARRLLPAVVLVVVAVLGATAVVARDDLPERSGEAGAAALYVSNWWTIAQGQSYFDRFAGPGPLDHLWSLAIEEQFYVVWPLLLLLLLRRAGGRFGRVARGTLLLAVVSFVLLAVVADPGFDNTRAYEGTDTRAGGLLVGAVLAMAWRPLPRARIRVTARLVIDAIGLAGLAVIIWLVATTTEYDLSTYRWGLLLLSVATACLVAAVVHPGAHLGAVLGIGPLRWLGERSYGIYLWHLPVFAFAPSPVEGGVPLLRDGLLVGVTVLLAAMSWSLVEDPIRRRGLVGAVRRLRPGPRPREQRRLVPAVVSGAAVVVLVATGTLSATALVDRPGPSPPPVGLDRPPLPPPETANGAAAATPSPDPKPSPSAAPTASRPPAASPAPSPGAGSDGRTARHAAATSTPGGGAPRTSCTSVVHVGDSTSIGLMDHAYQPDPKLRVDAQYRKHGVSHVTTDISGARSIVETYDGHPNAQDAVRRQLAEGYEGCWVLALGTNEAANQYVGGVVPFPERIDLVMGLLGDAPALWTTVRTLKHGGPYGDAQMTAWNGALVDACRRYPNMRVYDWRSEVRDGWYISDGIHFTTTGYGHRAIGLARALARAFPAEGNPPAGCLVRSR
jgi:peptidoglycan/LPS O-acetylase OafA/YrhL